MRGSYLHHKEIKAAQGIKIAAPNLESAVAGTQMLVVQKGDSIDDLKAEVMGDMTDIFKSVDKTGLHSRHPNPPCGITALQLPASEFQAASTPLSSVAQLRIYPEWIINLEK